MNKIAWNKNKSVGQKKPFTPKQLEILREILLNKEKWMELTLLNGAINTILRYSDVTNLLVQDVVDWQGKIKDEINLKQQKTKSSHIVFLSAKSKKALEKWLKVSKKLENNFLFSGNTKIGEQRTEKLSRTSYAKIIKKWAEYLHLDPEDYSSHSLRRTGSTFMYKQGVSIEIIRRLLGQKSIESTRSYLGIENQEAFEIRKKFLI